MGELFKLCVTHMKDFLDIYPLNMGDLWCFPYKLGNGLHGEPQKENSNWCDWLGGQSSLCDEVARPLSICQSFCHVGGPWILAATQTSPSSYSHGFASGKFSFFPLLSFWSPSLLHKLLSQLYKLFLFSLLFPLPPTLALGKRGKEGSMLRGVGFFHRSWHPWQSVTRHFALSFMLSSPSTLSLRASFFYFPMKSHSSLPRNLSPSFWSFHLSVHVCFSPLECLAEALEVVEPVSQNWHHIRRGIVKKKKRYAQELVKVSVACAHKHVWEMKDEI